MWILIGAFISIVGAGIAAWATYKSGIKSGKETKEIIATGSNTNALVSELKEKNEDLHSELDSIKVASETQLQQIRNLTTQNADLAIQLGNSTLLVSQSITGGDGFCELDFKTMPNMNAGKVYIKNHGKYPLHDFKARVCELEELEIFYKNNPGTLQPGTDIPMLSVKPPEFNIELGTILANDTKELPVLITLGKHGKKSSFNIFINGKNGHFCQLLRYYNVKNKWVKATRILDLKDSMKTIILHEHIDKDFPTNELKWE